MAASGGDAGAIQAQLAEVNRLRQPLLGGMLEFTVPFFYGDDEDVILNTLLTCHMILCVPFLSNKPMML